jgi:regulator of RNase E activity RraA
MASTAPAVRPGFIVRKSITRPQAELVARFKELVAANISDVQGRQGTLDYRIKSIYPLDKPLVGPAITVKTRPGDNLVPFKAIEIAQPGDVIVIAGDFETNLSVWGGIMSAMAKKKGIAGMVTDCLVRDVAQTREVGFPVFATGLTPVGPTKNGTGGLNVPISCGGVVINPGDIIVADEDGVVAVHQDEAEAVYERTMTRVEVEKDWLKRIAQDELFLMESDDDLRKLGAQVFD